MFILVLVSAVPADPFQISFTQCSGRHNFSCSCKVASALLPKLYFVSSLLDPTFVYVINTSIMNCICVLSISLCIYTCSADACAATWAKYYLL